MKNDRIIYVNYLSRFANHMFQYVFAHLLNQEVEGTIFFAPYCTLWSGPTYDQPREQKSIKDCPIYYFTDSSNILEKREWQGKFKPQERNNLRNEGVVFAEDIVEGFYDKDMEKITLKKTYTGQPIILSGYFQYYKFYKYHKDFIKKLFKKLYEIEVENRPDSNDLVINYRGADTACYQYPLSYYDWAIKKEKNCKKVWIVSDDPDSVLIRKLCSKYYSKREIHILPANPIHNFVFLLYAKKIVMSISTFSWFAAWLSEAEKIYFPASHELYNTNGDNRLIVDNEERYVYVSHKKFLFGRIVRYLFNQCRNIIRKFLPPTRPAKK